MGLISCASQRDRQRERESLQSCLEGMLAELLAESASGLDYEIVFRKKQDI
jgi:hypothetical protein